MTPRTLRQFMAGFLSITFAFIFLAVVSPAAVQAKPSSVSSTRATLNPPNPKPGESFFVEISGSGSPGSWCRLSATVSIPGLNLSQTKNGTVQRGHGLSLPSFQFQVPTSVPAGTDLTPSIQLSGCGGGSVGLASNVSRPTVAAVPSPALTVEKTAPSVGEYLFQGENFDYSIVVTNTGDAPAVSTTLIDDLNLNYLKLRQSDANTETDQGGGIRRLQWNFGTLQPGEFRTATIAVQVLPSVTSGTVINNAATAQSGTISATSQTYAKTVHDAPLLSLKKGIDRIGQDTVSLAPGDKVTYVIEVTNSGEEPARDVLVQDSLEDLINVTLSGLTAANSMITSGTAPVIALWEVGELGPGETVTLKATGTLRADVSTNPADGGVVNKAIADSSNALVKRVESNETVIILAQEAQIAFEKIALTPNVKPGDIAEFQLLVKNIGNVDARNMWVQDPIDGIRLTEPVTVKSPSSVYRTLLDGQTKGVLAFISFLPVGQSAHVFNYSAKVPDDAVVGSTSTNSAFVFGRDDLIPAATNDHPMWAKATFNIVGLPVLAVSKTANKPEVGIGEEAVFTITVNNTGNEVTDGGVSVVDFIDDTLEIVKVNPPATSQQVVDIGGQNYTELAWSGLRDLKPSDAPHVLEITVKPVASLGTNDVGLYLGNSARASSEFNGNPLQSRPASSKVRFEPKPKPVISKIPSVPVTQPLQPGRSIRYTLEVSPPGADPLQDVSVFDTMPPNLEFSHSVPAPTSQSTDASGNTRYTYYFDKLERPATITIFATVSDTTQNGDKVTNLASASTPNLRAEVVAPGVTHEVYEAGYSISKKLLGNRQYYQSGDTLSYQLTYENTGAVTNRNTVLTDVLSHYLELVPVSSPGYVVEPVDSNDPDSAQKLVWNLGQVDPGKSHTVSFDARIKASTPDNTVINNIAHIVSNETGDIASNIVTIHTEPVELEIKKTVDSATGFYNDGDPITFTISYANIGSVDAPNTIITDVLPSLSEGFEYRDVQGAAYNAATNTVSLDLGTLPANSLGGTIVIHGYARNGGVADLAGANRASIVSRENGTIRASTADTVGYTVRPGPIFTLQKRIDGDNQLATAKPGDTVRYELILSKRGGAATDIKVTDKVPSALENITANRAYTLDANGALVFAVPDMPAGSVGPVTITIEAVVKNPLEPGSFPNTAVVTAAEFKGGVTSNQVILNVDSQPDLVISKTADKVLLNSPPSGQGDAVIYTLTYENRGTASASQVTVHDDLASSFTNVSSPDATATVTGNSVEWDIGTLPPGQRHSVSVTARVKTGLVSGLLIPNKARINGTGATGTSHNSESTVVDVRVGVASLLVTKTADKAVVNPGEELGWTISYRNNGTADTGPITLSDTLPDALSYVANSATYPSGASVATSGTNGLVFSDLPSLAPQAVNSVSFKTTVAAVVPSQQSTLQNIALASATQVPGLQSLPLTAPPKVSTQPELGISKSANVAKTHPGDTVTFTIEVVNKGSDKATNVQVVDKLSSLLTLKSATGKPKIQGQQLTWSLTELAAKSGRKFTVTAQVKAPLADGKNVPNTASVTALEDPAGKSVSLQIPVRSPVLDVMKSASVKSARAGDAGKDNGDSFSYLISVTNTGSSSASGITLTDTIPAEFKILSARALKQDCAVSGQRVECAIPSLIPGDQVEAIIKVKATEGLRDGLVVNNTATVSSSLTGSSTSAPVSVTINSAPLLVLTKATAVDHVSPGDTLRYTLTVTNVGSDIASGYTVTDKLPQYTTFDSASDDGKAANGEVIWGGAGQRALPDLAPGTNHVLTLDVVLANSIPNNHTIANSAQLNYLVNGAPTQVNSQLPPGGSHPAVTSAPKLTIQKAANAGKQVTPSQQVTYTLTVQNTGNAPANNVTVTDTLPDNVSYIPGASAADTSALPKLSWSLGTVDPGTPKVILVDVEVASPLANGTRLNNTAEVQIAGLTVDATSVTQRVVSAPRLIVKKTPAKQKASAGTVVSGVGQQNGEGVTFQIRYDNLGDANATDVTLTDKLDPNLRFVSASHGGKWSASSRTISWKLGDLSPGSCSSSSCTVSVQAQVADGVANGTEIENYAHITSDQASSTSARAVVRVHSEGRLVITKTVVGSQVVKAGKLAKYLIEYSNVGSDALENVIVSDHLAPGTQLDYASDGGVLKNGKIVWFEGASKRLPAGSSGVLHLTVALPSVIANSAILKNTATVSGATASARVAAYDLATITASSAPRLRITKAGPKKKSLRPGQRLSYEVAVTNTGNDIATGVTVTDLLPDDVSFVSASDGGLPDASNPRVVRWSFGSKALKPGDSMSLTVTVQVDSPLANNTVLSNSAQATDQVTKTVAASNIVQRTVTSRPYLEIEKSIVGASGPVTRAPGEPVTFLLTISNSGTDTATGVVLEDHLPVGLTLSAVESVAGIDPQVSGGVISWALGNLPAGQSRSVHVYAGVDATIVNGATLDNFASVISNETRTQTAHAPLITAASAPAIAVTKVTQVNLVSPDLQYSYEIDWFNFGSDAATAAQIRDCLPSGVVFVSASHGGQQSGSCGPNRQEVLWTLGDVAAKTGGAVWVNVQVKNAIEVKNGDLLTNLVSVSATNMPASSTEHTVVVDSRPALVLIERTSSPVIAAGEAVLYTLTFSNFGNAVAENVQVTDQLPIGALPQSVSSGGKFDLNNGLVAWTVGSLPPGGSVSVTYSLASQSGTPDGTLWASTASITASNAWPTSASSEVLIGSAPRFSLDKVGPSAVGASEEVTWRIDYFNSGNGAATDVVIQDVIPAGWTFVSSPQSPSVNNRVVTWNLGRVEALAGGRVDITLQAPAIANDGTGYLNTASIQASNTSAVQTAFASVVVHSHTDLDVTIAARRTPVEANAEETLDVTWSNAGNQDAPNAEITVTLPPKTQFVSATGNYRLVGNTLIWTVADALPGGAVGLPAGGSDSASLVIRVDDGTLNGTVLKSQAEITAGTGTPAIDVAKFEVSSSPILVMSKSIDTPQASVGDVVTYTITVSNQGNEAATGVVIADQLPPELQLLASDTTGAVIDQSRNEVSLSVGVLPEPGGSATLSFRAKVLAAAGGKTVINTAEVSCNELPTALTTAATDVSQLEVLPVPVDNRWLLLMIALLVVTTAYWGLRLKPIRIAH